MQVSPAKIFARPMADDIWLGPSQREALSRLSSAHRVKVLLGPSSSGKTTLLRHLGAVRSGAVHLALRGPLTSAADVLVRLLEAAGLEPWQLSEVEQRNLLSVFIDHRRRQGRDVVLTLDGAERVCFDAWDEIDRLMSQSFRGQSALELIVAAPTTLIGVPVLEALLADPKTRRHELPPASDECIEAYLAWRLERHGLNRDLFTTEGIRLMCRTVQGRYAAADVIAQMALLLAREQDTARIDVRVVREACRNLAVRQCRDEVRARQLPRAEAAPGTHPDRLIATRDGKLHGTFALAGRVLIGRNEHNDLCLPSPYLSRHHAVIVGTSDGYYVVDLNSVNGLLLNGRLVRRAVLSNGDLLSLGPYRLKVEIGRARSARSPIPEGTSLDDTAVMPPQPRRHPDVRVVK